MTTELTKAAPGNHGAIHETDLYDFAGWLTTRPGVMAVGSSCEAGPMAEAVGEYIKTFPERFALTQRPAAQTEREAFEAEMRCEETWGHRSLRKHVDGRYQNWMVDALWTAWQARASLPAPQQATPGPLTLGPLAKRNIYDAIRGAYDLGYNDARNARTVPGDFAPRYDGRSVEEDHGVALFNLLSKRLTPATPEPVGEPFGWVCRYLCHADDDGEQRWTDWHFTLSSESVPPKWSRGSYAEQEAVPVFTRPAPGVPEGFALVPVEPTQAMLDAADKVQDGFNFGLDDIYKAMLAARPLPAPPAQKEPT